VGQKLSKKPPRSDDEVRQIMLEYFFNRNLCATSRIGKKTGAAVGMKLLRAELKASHGLTVQEIHSNLTYLLSNKWVEVLSVTKTIMTPSKGMFPSTTDRYIITAQGIDKIKGGSLFMTEKFERIKIEAKGQNVITVGANNEVHANFREVSNSLTKLAELVNSSPEFDEQQKDDIITDITSLTTQLAKQVPNASVIHSLWAGIQTAVAAAGFTHLIGEITQQISNMF
jgi:hypothetical protein